MKKGTKDIGRREPSENRLGLLTKAAADMLRHHIRKNSVTIDQYIKTIDLLVNKEQCPKDANTLLNLRKRLEIAVSENDTFRNVLWHHIQMAEQLASPSADLLTPTSFLMSCIKSRKYALIAQNAMIPHHFKVQPTGHSLKWWGMR
ncbi:MAG: hypothetical protein A3G87_09380 [Omnitrophica bacterium RIFCSPLOWO2_12_FULL_50_11]|nr:MAG: hypothetical protein A3G87_09380 [Omnitrophica bacterium RIFCSPLOWO2_12_FULL_50_11]